MVINKNGAVFDSYMVSLPEGLDGRERWRRRNQLHHWNGRFSTVHYVWLRWRSTLPWTNEVRPGAATWLHANAVQKYRLPRQQFIVRHGPFVCDTDPGVEGTQGFVRGFRQGIESTTPASGIDCRRRRACAQDLSYEHVRNQIARHCKSYKSFVRDSPVPNTFMFIGEAVVDFLGV
jgi:hypothetical protein